MHKSGLQVAREATSKAKSVKEFTKFECLEQTSGSAAAVRFAPFQFVALPSCSSRLKTALIKTPIVLSPGLPDGSQSYEQHQRQSARAPLQRWHRKHCPGQGLHMIELFQGTVFSPKGYAAATPSMFC
jgi:hypothetical protein